MMIFIFFFFFSNPTLEIFQKLNERNGTKYRGVKDFDFQMMRSLRSSTEKKRKKDVDSKNDRGGGGKKKNLDKCHFQKLDFEKKTLRSMRSCLSREKEREICFERPPNYFPRSFLTSKIQLTSRFIEIYVAL